MPKSIMVEPWAVRQRAELNSATVPLNSYIPDARAESAIYGSGKLVQMYRDMVYIREFETMLDRCKKEGRYRGIEYSHPGPAHLSIGQEAAAVGQSFHLTPDDLIFGSHRSHGEILAKAFSSIAKLEEAVLMDMMERYFGGITLHAVDKFPVASVRELAINFTLYGVLAEIFSRSTGFNRGMGGSMHVFFPPFGIMPNNAIVGGSAAIATGAALFKRVNMRPGICVANIGDAALGCGPVWEAMMFAAMDQYLTLWDRNVGGAPPILFNFVNNFYGMGGQTLGETMGLGILARAGLGINPDAMHTERVDGSNPLAVADAIDRKMPVLLAGNGPVMLDTVTYRISGHSSSDASSYRERAEVDAWLEHDPIGSFGRILCDQHHATVTELEDIKTEAEERMLLVLRTAIDPLISPYFDARGGDIGALMFSNHFADCLALGVPTTLCPKSETRFHQTSLKSRSGLKNGERLPKSQCLTYADAIFEAMLHRFYEDPTMIAYGEENRDWGGAFGAYRGLTECLPYHRLFNSPISEAAIVGTAVGYALAGGRVVVELMYCDFIGRAGDEIFNQMAKWQAMSAGALQLPMVLRVSVGARYGAQHSQDWTALVAHIPGLRVMFPATPYDAKGMLSLALRGTDPVVFFESQRLYSEPELLVPGGVPVDYFEIPLGVPALRRTGTDVTIITIGATLYRALEAADVLQSQYNLSAEVIDLRFLNPLDYGPLIDSVRKTGKVVLASDACERGSFLHTVASNLSQLVFDYLDGPVTVVGARNWITPPVELEESYFPQKEWIIDTLHERIAPIPNHIPSTSQRSEEIITRSRAGI